MQSDRVLNFTPMEDRDPEADPKAIRRSGERLLLLLQKHHPDGDPHAR